MRYKSLGNELSYELLEFGRLSEKWFRSLLKLWWHSFLWLLELALSFFRLMFEESRLKMKLEPGREEEFELRKLKYEHLLGPPRM